MSQIIYKKYRKGVIQLPGPGRLGLASLFVIWLIFAIWQRSEHQHQCRLIDDSLESQGKAFSTAVSSNVRSHRWFGPFVREQLPTTLNVLSQSEGVIAIAVIAMQQSDEPYVGGDPTRIDDELPVGNHVDGNVLQIVREFTMNNEPPPYAFAELDGIPPEVVVFKSIVALDRTETIRQHHAEARNRILLFLLGTLLLISVAAVWRFTVRLAHSEGQTRLLTAEARHLRELGHAAAGLAHETRNPLGLIRGWTQRIVDEGLPSGEQREQAESVLEECDRVTSRINQFLAFARPAEVKLEPTSLDELADELETLLQNDLSDKNVSIRKEGLEQASLVLADRDQLRQVLFNLLQNAIAFSPDEATITIRLISLPKEIHRLEIVDQGQGIPDEIAESVFEPYVTRRLGGTGLGLSIVRRIVLAHDWDVGYEPAPDGGSVFWINGLRTANVGRHSDKSN